MIHSTININNNNGNNDNNNNNNNNEIEEINTLDSLSNALKSHITFQILKDTFNEYSKLIKYGNFVSLKHITTGKYLTTDDKKYLTGSRGQIVFSTDALPEANAIWKINYPFGSQPKANNEIVSYGDTISLQNKLGKMLWAYPNYKSPTSGHVEVSCYSMNQYNNWMIEPNISNISTKKNSNEEKRYLKSEDKIVIWCIELVEH
ncbi:unnamed protein product [Rhizophagus irregularis]|uniref:MIR domain-containing protein n=1 Tax=Rhizophagus irregularis TaxID=588596 RepID=A0A915YZ57_9GLOM|nr:unnamed protein product [Rhizophagus irregularis]